MKNLIVSVCVIIAVAVLAWLFVGYINDGSNVKQNDIVVNAVKRAALTCYAVEGAYPLELDYLRDNYGLKYDEERYTVIYRAFATNLMPSITVVDPLVK